MGFPRERESGSRTDTSGAKLREVRERADGSGDADVPNHRKLEKLSSPGPEKPTSDATGRRFEGIELCLERLLSPAGQQWLRARLLPLTSASFFLAMAPAPTPRRCIPAVARRPPSCRDPGSPRPGIRRRLPDAEARVVRHLRAPEATPELPAAGVELSHSQGPNSPAPRSRRDTENSLWPGAAHLRALFGPSRLPATVLYCHPPSAGSLLCATP